MKQLICNYLERSPLMLCKSISKDWRGYVNHTTSLVVPHPTLTTNHVIIQTKLTQTDIQTEKKKIFRLKILSHVYRNPPWKMPYCSIYEKKMNIISLDIKKTNELQS